MTALHGSGRVRYAMLAGQSWSPSRGLVESSGDCGWYEKRHLALLAQSECLLASSLRLSHLP